MVIKTSFAVLATFLLCAAALADEVRLKDGRVVKGYIVEDTSRVVRIETVEGRIERFPRDQVASVAETYEVGAPDLDAKLGAATPGDWGAYVDIAREAKEKGVKGWHLVAKIAIRLNADSDDAHELLGHKKVDDKWYESAKEAEKAEKEALDKRLADEGYVKFKDGWISKEDRAEASKNPKAFVKDERGIWRNEAELMKEKGYVLMGGKWVPGPTDEDRTDMARFKELMGEEIFVVTGKHFRLFAQQYPAEQVMEFSKLLDDVYAWFVKELKIPEGTDVFRGTNPHLWVFKDKAAALDWFKHYEKPTDPGYYPKMVDRSGGNVRYTGRRFGTIVPNQQSDIRNQLVHHAGHFLITWLQGGRHPTWMGEAFAHFAEDSFLGSGTVNCTTTARYGEGGGIADKEFNTQDAKDRAKYLSRNKKDRPLESLNKLDLNSLNGDDLTKGWTFVVWMMKAHRDGFLAWLEEMRQEDVSETWYAMVMNAIAKKIQGLAAGNIDEEWRKHIKEKY